MSQRYTWTKAEKLKSRKRIEWVFKEGKSLSVFPFKVFFLLTNPAPPNLGARPASLSAPPSPLQAGFGAGSRHFKKAVDRNRIKRLSREAYRLQKQPLMDLLTEKGISMAVFFIYTGKELPDHSTVKAKIGVALQKLIKEVK
jgi:ribonuclease P protein component